jgi:hypothetical protein
MRMDIENSPGAPVRHPCAGARDDNGPGGGVEAAGEGKMNGKRFCSICHPATLGGERAGRFFAERTMGVLWRHSSVNLVEPRSIALAAAEFSGGCRRSKRG